MLNEGKMKAFIKSKIVAFIIVLFGFGRGYSWSQYDKSTLKELNKRINKYYLLIRINRFIKFEWYWHDDIEEIKMLKDTAINSIFDQLDDDKKYIFTKLLYYSGRYYDEITEKVIRFCKTTNSQYRYWTTMDISRFTFHQQKGFYPNYYIDRRNLLSTICNDMDLVVPSKKAGCNNNLCIVTHLLDGSIKNSVQRVATMIANGLISEFDEIAIFPLDTFTPVGKEKRQLTTVLPIHASIDSKNAIESIFPQGVCVHYPIGDDYIEKAQDILYAIYDYNPRVILDMSDEYSAISFYYSKDFYTVYQPMRGGGTSSYFSKITGKKWMVLETNRIFNSIDINKVADWTFPEYVPPQGAKMSKKDLAYNDNDFVLVCAGNNATCCDKKFVDCIAKLLIDKKRIKLLFVGQGAPDYFKKEYNNLFQNKQVREWGYESNLFGLYSACDVLVRPNMTGGSGATAIAAMAGLPIAMTDFVSDPNRWLGLEYSPNHNYSELMDYIVKLSEDSDFYIGCQQKCKELVYLAIDSPAKWKELANILKEQGDK